MSSHTAGPSDIAQEQQQPPVQPEMDFRKSCFGKAQRSFQRRWYELHPWLEYSVSLDAAFCYACRLFHNNAEVTFTSSGYRDWKHALGVFKIHCNSKTHQEAMLNWAEYKRRIPAGKTIGMQLDRMGEQQIAINREYVQTVMECLLYCSQQGIALRGHDESETALNPGNFRCLIKLMSKHSHAVKQRLQDCPNVTWLSPAFQNEMIRFLADEVRAMIQQELSEAQYYTVLADESKDISKEEQLSIAFRYVLGSEIVERFAGYIHAKSVKASTLSDYILSQMGTFGLDHEKMVSQCYDGASVMSGCNSGVQSIIRSKCKQAVYVHCNAHRLNLVLVDVVRNIQLAHEFFELLELLYVFLSSSKCHEKFIEVQKARGDREIRLKKLSETRWACRYDSIAAVLATFLAVIETLEYITNDSDKKRAVEAKGILASVTELKFIVCLVVYKKLFGITSRLSELLQNDSADICGTIGVIKATILNFTTMRCDSSWEPLWCEVTSLHDKIQGQLDVNIGSRPTRSHYLPTHLQNSFVTANTTGTRSCEGTRSLSPSQQFKVELYFPTLEHILSEMDRRFHTQNLTLMNAIDSLHPKSMHFLELEPLLPLYKHYQISSDTLENELGLFKPLFSEIDGSSGKQCLRDILEALLPVQHAFPTLKKATVIAMTFGVSTATVERSFSSLRRIKTYLRSTMSQGRLDDLALLNIERQLSSKLWDCLPNLVLKFATAHKNSKIVLM